MGSLRECRIEGFICRLCSAINSNVIHIYSEEGEELSLKNESFFGGISSLSVRWVELGENLFNNIFSIGFLGLMKKLEQKINVYLKIDVSSRSTELPMALKMCEILIKFFLTSAASIWSTAESDMSFVRYQTGAASSFHSACDSESENERGSRVGTEADHCE